MYNYQYKALEITEKIVVETMSNASINFDSESGEKVGDFFKAVYSKVEEVTKNVNK